jgi:nucleoside-diphosphate-sugar epimerase
MKVLIIGGGGFLGQRLARKLAERGTLRGQEIAGITLADVVTPAPVTAGFPVTGLPLDITDAEAVQVLIAEGFDVIYHLAAVVSGQAEADFDIGMRVNLQGSINVFEAVRAAGHAPVVVFTSSVAVYGGDTPNPIEDWTALNPQTSYGAQKAAAELLLTDYSRKGFLDGRGLRLPTISIRPGKPNAAASGFMSSIFREPMQGQAAVCPVGPDYMHWYLSPRRCIDNLVHGAEVEAGALGMMRCFALPGRTHRLGDMVEAMGRIAGPETVERISWKPDPAVQAIVGGWKAHFRPEKALALGFTADDGFEDNIRFFLEDDCVPA